MMNLIKYFMKYHALVEGVGLGGTRRTVPIAVPERIKN
jgi:hypothetical protein